MNATEGISRTHLELARVLGATPGQLLVKVYAPGTLPAQDHALYPWRTVAENMGFELELAGVASAERQERVTAILGRVGLRDFARYYPHQPQAGCASAPPSPGPW